MEANPTTHLEVEIGKRVGEPRIRKVCKTMCVTTVSSLMVISWASTSMSFSGIAGYWIFTSMPYFRAYPLLVLLYYPTTAALGAVLIFSPVFAVAGDLRCGNFRMLLAGVIPLNVIGVVVTGVLLGVAVGVLSVAAILAYVLVVGYILLYLAMGIFQTNAIQYGRDVLRNSKSPELSNFVYWYYWALHIPIFLFGVPILVYLSLSDVDESLFLINIIVILSFMVIFVAVFAITLAIHCSRSKSGEMATVDRIAKNPVKLVCKVTQYALQRPASPGHRDFFTRLNNVRRSKGGPSDDEEVDSVAKFWFLVLLMASSFGFLFWDDMWAVSFVLHFETDSEVFYFLGSQLTTSAVVSICVPVYQFIVRPFMGKHTFPLLWRILIGLILELISLAFVTWSSAVTTSKTVSRELSYVCYDITLPESVTFDFESSSWYILIIPQVINGFSHLLVFPAVIELILTAAPRVMHGLLIGLWYSLQSIHLIVSIIETATCAVFYWQYYLMKIALVLISIISFGATALYYKRKQAMQHDHMTSMDDRKVADAPSEHTV